jgi:prevent-host-death family protein
MEISVYEAKSKLSEMINKALAGEEIIVTRNGEPKIKLTPIVAKRNWVGLYEGKGEVLPAFFDSIENDETVQFLTGEFE